MNEASTSATVSSRQIHICHIVLRLGTGGMENGLVNLIQSLDPDRFRHTVLCLRDKGSFADRLCQDSVEMVSLGIRPSDRQWATYKAVYKTLRRLRPDVVHTRNLSTCDLPLVARCARVKAVIHSEHGLDVAELRGDTRRYIWIRRSMRPFVSHYITLGHDLKEWLIKHIRVSASNVTTTYNGVDVEKFRPILPAEKLNARRQLLPSDWPTDAIVIGTVGRLSPIKNYDTLIQAISICRNLKTESHKKLRLLLVGDGPERTHLEKLIANSGLEKNVWISGFSDAVPNLLSCMDLFVLPSICEGISNTILEAQASGIPVIATAVGGTGEIVLNGKSALLIPPEDAVALASSITRLVDDPKKILEMSQHGRNHVLAKFTWANMAKDHSSVYLSALELADGSS